MYSRACDLFANEPLWKVIKDEEERTELFNDAIKEKEKLEQVWVAYSYIQNVVINDSGNEQHIRY